MKIKKFTFLLALIDLITLSCCKKQEEASSIVSLFANSSETTYFFLNEADSVTLDYENPDSVNSRIMNSAIVASSGLYICDLLARTYSDSTFIEVFFDNNWHLLKKDSTIKIEPINTYLIGKFYELKENDIIYVDGKKERFHSKENNAFIIDDVDGDYIVLSKILFSINEFGDAISYDILKDAPQVRFMWKNEDKIVPNRLIMEW